MNEQTRIKQIRRKVQAAIAIQRAWRRLALREMDCKHGNDRFLADSRLGNSTRAISKKIFNPLKIAQACRPTNLSWPKPSPLHRRLLRSKMSALKQSNCIVKKSQRLQFNWLGARSDLKYSRHIAYWFTSTLVKRAPRSF